MERLLTTGLAWQDYVAARGRAFDRVGIGRTGAPPLASVRATAHPLEAAWGTGWPEEVAALYAPDGVRHERTRPERRHQGRAAIAAAAGLLMAAGWYDLEVTRSVCGDDVVVVEWRLLAPGDAGEAVGVSVCRMDGGLIGEEHVYWDAAASATRPSPR